VCLGFSPLVDGQPIEISRSRPANVPQTAAPFQSRVYLVMEKVSGRPLSAAISEGPFEPHRALALARQILSGAGHAHGHGVVHRDLKPDNVLLVPMTGWERAVVIDFGIVKLMGDAAAAFGAAALTSTGHVFGTPQYMAPEQALGRLVDPRADLYAIGVMLYEMLAGAPPFRDPDPMALMYLHAKVAPKPLRAVVHEAPWCTPAVVALVEGALAKDPEHRFPSAAVMTAVLEDAFASIS
jgi:serine/threonine-protein kinase